MSVPDFEPSYEFVQQAARQPGVRKAIEKIANRVAKRAESLAGSEGVDDMNVWVETGIRPLGRPFANVVTDGVTQEWGTSTSKKRRIMGRAAHDAK